VAAGRRGDAAEYFMVKVVGLPAEFAAQALKEAVVAGPGSYSAHARLRCYHHGRLFAAN
jgi:hypothetical protein